MKKNENSSKETKPFYGHYTPWGGSWRWAQVSPDGVAPSRMVGVSASVNLPLNHKVQKFSSGTGSPGWSRKKGRKMVVVWCGVVYTMCQNKEDTKRMQ